MEETEEPGDEFWAVDASESSEGRITWGEAGVEAGEEFGDKENVSNLSFFTCPTIVDSSSVLQGIKVVLTISIMIIHLSLVCMVY